MRIFTAKKRQVLGEHDSWPGGDVGAGGRLAFLQSLADGTDRRNLPETPSIEYTGPPGYPIDRLTFRSGPFADPQGAQTFGAMKWGIAEISDIPDPGSIPLSDPVWRREPVRLELQAVWESEDLSPFAPEVAIPEAVLEPGRRYRVRVRMKDATELWSHWSAPIEFTAGPAVSTTPEEEGGLQRPGDARQDGRLDLADAIVLLGHLFSGSPETLPCGDGTTADPANRMLLDLNGDRSIDLGDGIYLLEYLFANGPPPALGIACIRIEGCPDACR